MSDRFTWFSYRDLKIVSKQRADRAELDLQKMRERLLKLGVDPNTLP